MQPCCWIENRGAVAGVINAGVVGLELGAGGHKIGQVAVWGGHQ